VRWIVVLSLVTGLSTSHPARAEPWYRGEAGRRRLTHLAFAAGAGTLYTISETVAKPPLAPDHCRWCNVDALDDKVRGSVVWSDPKRAATISNVTGFVVSPVVLLGLSALAAASTPGAGPDDTASRIVDDAIPILETAAYSELGLQIVKFAAGRQRPYAHYNTDLAFEPTQDDNLSWFSAHATLTFGLTISAGIVAHRRGSALEPVIWVTGLGLATTTSYLRIAGDKHYLTDVLAGAAWGTAAALLIPRITGSLPDKLHVVPSGNGVAVAGTF
jgi:hypothetical protein